MEPDNAKASQNNACAENVLASPRRHVVALLLAFCCFAIDIATKTWARSCLPERESVAFLPPFLKFTLVTNTGAAFSLGQDNGQAVAIISTLVFLVLFIWSIARYKSNNAPLLEELGMALVLGSAFGNLIDRYLYGRVTDFLEFDFIKFPVFNMADVLIDVGIGLVLITLFRKGQE